MASYLRSNNSPKPNERKYKRKLLSLPITLHPSYIAYLLPYLSSPLFKSHPLISKLFSFFFFISFQTKEEQKKKGKKAQGLPVRTEPIPT